jgi:membrane fusion protein, heavy metal efflux system
MSYRSGLLTGLMIGALVAVAAVAAWQWSSPKPVDKTKPAEPATVAHPLKEGDVNTIVLTDSAMQRVAIQVAPVKVAAVGRTRVYGGEVMVKPGLLAIVSAPVSGTLELAAGELPNPGQKVTAGQPLLELLPVLTPEGRANLTTALVDAGGLVKSAETQLAAGQIALNRAQRVFKNEAGSRRAVDEAQAIVDLAQQALTAALARKSSLAEIAGDAERGKAGPLPIESPETGLLRAVTVVPGQMVPAGAPLFEVVNLDRVWVRVPVFVADQSAIDRKANAAISPLAATAQKSDDDGLVVTAPPTANPLTGTVDFYYEVDNRKETYRPGQRVAARLALAGEREGSVIPWSAVVLDIYGGTWVYEQTAERTFVRRRVVVEHVQQDEAVLASGPPPGAKIVVAGAAELFGTETGFTK